MNILIVGGTGLTGATAACYLRDKGHQVTLMSRSKPENPALNDFPFIVGDYIQGIAADELEGFEALVFAAGADLRMLPEGKEPAAFFDKANSKAIPEFFKQAKAAGIKRAVYIGSYYPQVVPEKIETDPYVKSRFLADEAVRALSDETFCVCSLNAPFILGYFPGVAIPHLEGLVNYCAGRIEALPLVAPEGGVNHITAQSMAEAIEGALQNGQCGKAYLVGDENLSWKEYFDMFCEAVGNTQVLQTTADEHPLLPDIILYAGRNATVHYEPDNAELNYSTGQVKAAMQQLAQALL